MSSALFLGRHLLALVTLSLSALGAGTLVAGRRHTPALRAVLGLALCGHVLFVLAYFGELRVFPIVALIAVAILGGALRMWLTPHAPARFALVPLLAGGALFALLFLVALRPPLAFDETLYHLPFVRELARSGVLQFQWGVRFPVFPQLHELLCVPLFLLAGDTATHLVSLVETAITAALLFDWGRRQATGAGPLAAAFFLGSPIVVALATVTYVDAALTLFVTAGFYCLDRSLFEHGGWLALSGIFLGTACSVKYLGGYFAVAALVLVAVRSPTRRTALPMFALGCLPAALPTTAWIISQTHNPVFPFLPQLFGMTKWSMTEPHVSLATHLMRMLRAPWDVTFARARMDFQPPFTPLLIPAVVLMIAASLRDVRARSITFICAGYLAIFTWMPQDSRYLVPLLPLIALQLYPERGRGLGGSQLYPERGWGLGGSEGSGGNSTERSQSAIATRSFAPTQPSAPAQDKADAVAARSFAPTPTTALAQDKVGAPLLPPPSLRINFLAFFPGILYAIYTLVLYGMPPLTPAAREAMLRQRIPEYTALTRAGGAPTYVYGAEQLNYYGRGALLGDVTGPYSNERILAGARDTRSIAVKLQDLNMSYFLVSKRRCTPPRPNGGMVLVYEDAAAQLWRLDRPAMDRDADGPRPLTPH